MLKVNNPILRGFNPDPSIIRVDDDYYIATSTFEWFPGVQIHHSRDLVNWRLLTRPLRRISQLDLRGVRASGGIWAPCLSCDGNLFYLVYTVVKTDQKPFMDAHNYLVTSKTIDGEWSEPVFLNSMGFDPSMFHDDDGRKWLVGMESDFRAGKKRFAGIFLREYCPKKQILTGPSYKIFEGTDLGYTEGPHLYKRNGLYYLITAEGGTGFGHAVTVARSKNLFLPFEADPNGPMLTSSDKPLSRLQKAGHADIVETKSGDWYMVHLCSRPIARKGRSILGRETALQKVKWTEDGWLRLADGGNEPLETVYVSGFKEHRWSPEPSRDDFDSTKLNINFQTLRVPLDDRVLSLTERKGFLRLRGGESFFSKYTQSLVARRQQAFCYTATTALDFFPQSYRQMAGLICLYDHENFYCLRLSYSEDYSSRVLGVLSCINGALSFPTTEVRINDEIQTLYLKSDVCHDILCFEYSTDEIHWQRIGESCDASKLSDEACREGGFTGAFVGVCCYDLTGEKLHADFDFFEYIEN